MSYLIIALFFTITAWIFGYRSWFNMGKENNMLNSMGASTLSLFFYYYWVGDSVYLTLLKYLPKGGESLLAGVILFLIWMFWVALPIFSQFLFMNKDGEIAVKFF